MRKFIAALLIVASPLALIAVINPLTTAAAATVTELGDLSSLSTIAEDTLVIARSGDLAGAQVRISDFESAWDQAAGTMQPLSPSKWQAVDVAADRAIESLRAATPDQAMVEAAVSGLVAELANPGFDAPSAAGTKASAAAPAVAFAVTNADGSPLPCEVALKTLRDAAGSATPVDQGKYDTLMNKGLERCTADDDKRADGFFADAFALLG